MVVFNRRTNHSARLLPAAASVALFAGLAVAADRTWTGASSSNGNFSTAGNWSGSTAPVAGDHAKLNSSTAARATVNMSGSATIGSLTVSGQSAAGAYQLTGGGTTLTIANDFSLAASTPFTLTTNSVLNADRTSLAAGASLTVQSGARLFTSSLFNYGRINVDSTGTFTLDGGAETSAGGSLNVLNGGDVVTNSFLDLGVDSAGTMLVTGAGSTLSAGETDATFTDWATVNGQAIVTLSQSAVATYNSGLRIAASFGTNNVALVNVESGAELIVAAEFIVGGAGIATININGGTLTSTGTTLLTSGARISLASGTFDFGGTLNLAGSAKFALTPTASKVFRADAINLADTSQFDLADNAMIIDYEVNSPIEQIRAYLLAGRNGGNWAGSGLITSRGGAVADSAIGYVEAADIDAGRSFFGQPVNETTLLLRYTLAGDTNLDGNVDLEDFTRLATTFGGASIWLSGDFNYNGMTNLNDFTALAANFGESMPFVPEGQEQERAVPEPTLVAPTILGLMLTRRLRLCRQDQ